MLDNICPTGQLELDVGTLTKMTITISLDGDS